MATTSTITTNPYSFTLTDDMEITPNYELALPASDTLLASLLNYDVGKTLKFTIPANVNVVKLYMTMTDAADNTRMYAYNTSNKVYWVYNKGLKTTNSITVYVGVTPGKAYTLDTYGVSSSASSDGEDWYFANLYIYYSSSINSVTPSVTDY